MKHWQGSNRHAVQEEGAHACGPPPRCRALPYCCPSTMQHSKTGQLVGSAAALLCTHKGLPTPATGPNNKMCKRAAQLPRSRSCASDTLRMTSAAAAFETRCCPHLKPLRLRALTSLPAMPCSCALSSSCTAAARGLHSQSVRTLQTSHCSSVGLRSTCARIMKMYIRVKAICGC